MSKPPALAGGRSFKWEQAKLKEVIMNPKALIISSLTV
ncbi:hypothetical protein BGP_6278 [Beggiatoa sp. PS]|nr:hypothetical protein BGP_6278 [Beggiatoa sp. PS]